MDKTPLLLVPGMICSPRLYAAQVAALSAEAEIIASQQRLIDNGGYPKH